jgi:hypothetical protein
MTNKIFTFGDGFATGHIWPEWPQILQVLVPEYTVTNTSAIGAGTEFLVTGLVDLLPDIANSRVVFQWPWHKRFDKLIEDTVWPKLVANDSYGFNCVLDAQKRNWWISSASQLPDVQQYHQHLVQEQQQILRQCVYRKLVDGFLKSNNCLTVHTSTEEQQQYSEQYKQLRGTSVQPSPIVHFYWLVNTIVPQLHLTVDQKRQHQLEQMILVNNWEPFLSNNQWDSIVKSLSL